jgi:integrase/recombinase XerD
MTPLRQRMLEDMQVRNLSPHTQRAYIQNVARFARHFGRSPADLGPEEIRAYQVYLVRELALAPSSVVMVTRDSPHARLTSETPPWPSSRASLAANNRRARSSRCGHRRATFSDNTRALPSRSALRWASFAGVDGRRMVGILRLRKARRGWH